MTDPRRLALRTAVDLRRAEKSLPEPPAADDIRQIVARLCSSEAKLAFIGAIVICTTPWMIIMTIGYVVRRGYYSPEDVQVFKMNVARVASDHYPVTVELKVGP